MGQARKVNIKKDTTVAGQLQGTQPNNASLASKEKNAQPEAQAQIKRLQKVNDFLDKQSKDVCAHNHAVKPQTQQQKQEQAVASKNTSTRRNTM